MIFKANGKEYPLIEGLRDKLKPDWFEMMKPKKHQKLESCLFPCIPFVLRTEEELAKHNISLVGKDILEAGCAYGERSYIMAKYEGTNVHGIDVDEYTADQSPDMNSWNPKDMEIVHQKLDFARKELAGGFPESVTKKVTFETCGMEKYATPNPHDMIISWDVLEHIIDLPLAFNQMANSVKKGGIVYHKYNPFFAINGGHSLCTLDFFYGHCVLSSKDFERYIREVRPFEEKMASCFYHKCLNRATRADIKELATKNGFEILEYTGVERLGEIAREQGEDLSGEVLETVKLHYPTVTVEDLICDSVHIILRKK